MQDKPKKLDYPKEQKFFDIIKHFPILGDTYKVARSYYFVKQGDQVKAKQSLETDLGNLSPMIRWQNIHQAYKNTKADLNQGVWIGKRSLGQCGWGMTFKPGMQLWHEAVLHKGTLYHLTGGDKDGSCKYQATKDKEIINSFMWNHVTDKQIPPNKSQQVFKTFKNEKCIYSLGAIFDDPGKQTKNCQTFTMDFVDKIGINEESKETDEALKKFHNVDNLQEIWKNFTFN